MPKLCKNKWVFWFVAYYHCIPISLILTLLGKVNCQVSKDFSSFVCVWIVKKRTSKIISRVCKLSSMVCKGTHVSIFFRTPEYHVGIWSENMINCLWNFFQALILPEKFQHILRILNTNIDGRRKIMFAMTAIKVR